MSRPLPVPACALLLAILLGAGPASSADLVEGAIAPAGECASSAELAPPQPARSPIATLFAPVGGPGSASGAMGEGSSSPDGEIDVAAGGPATGSPLGAAPGVPGIPGFDDHGPCDTPGSGCASLAGSRPGFFVPPGGVLQRDGWIRFPDGSLIRAPRADGTSLPPNLGSGGGFSYGQIGAVGTPGSVGGTEPER